MGDQGEEQFEEKKDTEEKLKDKEINEIENKEKLKEDENKLEKKKNKEKNNSNINENNINETDQIIIENKNKNENNIQLNNINNNQNLENERQITKEEAESFAEQENIKYIETSAIKNMRVEEAFTSLLNDIYKSKQEEDKNHMIVHNMEVPVQLIKKKEMNKNTNIFCC